MGFRRIVKNLRNNSLYCLNLSKDSSLRSFNSLCISVKPPQAQMSFVRIQVFFIPEQVTYKIKLTNIYHVPNVTHCYAGQLCRCKI